MYFLIHICITKSDFLIELTNWSTNKVSIHLFTMPNFMPNYKHKESITN